MLCYSEWGNPSLGGRPESVVGEDGPVCFMGRWPAGSYHMESRETG